MYDEDLPTAKEAALGGGLTRFKRNN